MEEQNMQQNSQQSNNNPEQPKAPGAQNATNNPNSKDVEENKLWAFVGYLGLLCLIPLLAKKDSPFAQFHAKQGLILTIACFFVWIPLAGWILGVAVFIFWIMGVISVFSGNMKPLPIVGELAKKINI